MILTVRDIQELQSSLSSLEQQLSEQARSHSLALQAASQREQELRGQLSQKDGDRKSAKDGDVRRLEKELEKKSELVDEVRDQLDYAQTQVQTLQAEVKKLRAENAAGAKAALERSQVQRSMNEKDEAIDELRGRVNELSKANSQLEERIEGLKRKQ